MQRQRPSEDQTLTTGNEIGEPLITILMKRVKGTDPDGTNGISTFI